MYFALGLLTAGMLAVLVTPAIWRRAMRLTRQRIESAVPMTLAEIQADRDQLRAEFAMNTRRLEMTADRLREKTDEQVFEIDAKRAEIVRISNERNEKAKIIEALKARGAELSDDLDAANERILNVGEDIRQANAALVTREGELASLRTRHDAEQQLSAEQRLDVSRWSSEVEFMSSRLADIKVAHETMTAERDELATTLAGEQAALIAARHQADNLEASLHRVEAERIERLAELERRAGEARDLLAEVARERTRADDFAARIADIGTNQLPIAETVHDNAEAIAAKEAEKAALAARVADLEADSAELRSENEELLGKLSVHRDIESENSLLRERLTSVAADIVRLSEAVANNEAEALRDESAVDPSGTAPDPHHHPTSVPAVKPQIGEASQPDEANTLAERLHATEPTATRH
jgi:chromosome segregation ATPase